MSVRTAAPLDPFAPKRCATPSIQRVREGGKAETLITKVGQIALNGPNDLVFAADGRLIFTDPGTYNPSNPDPSYIFAFAPDGIASVLVDFPRPVFPNGVAVEVGWLGRLGRIVHRPCPSAPSRWRN